MVKTAVGAVAVVLALVLAVAGAAVSVFGGGATSPSATATGAAPSTVAGIPAEYLRLYQAAATTCPGMSWSLLAGVGKIETNHGQAKLPGVTSGENFAHAAGPMQFLAPTFADVTRRHPSPPGGAQPPSRYNPSDAIYAAAAYLCDSGVRAGNVNKAVFTYNHSDAYVRDVLAAAHTYAASNLTQPAVTVAAGPGSSSTTGTAGPAAFVAVAWAARQIGTPYVWGGDGPAEGGFDCSGLTTAAYAAAGITLPRTAQTQYNAGPHLAVGQPVQPGDLLFYGTPGRVHHVGIAIGNNQMINAPQTGQTVRVAPYRRPRDDYLGATRPSGPAP